MSEFTMPSLGADMEAGTLATWRKQPGDPVNRGDIIAEVETDKGIIEVEVFAAGIVEKLLVEPGTKVPVGTALAIIREGTSPAIAAKPPPPPTPAPVPVPSPPSEPSPPPPPAERIRLSPAARRLARELGVDPRGSTGTGSGGALTRADIEALARTARAPAQPPSAPAPIPVPPAEPAVRERTSADISTRMRRAIAAAMSRSNREIPHYYVAETVDMTRTLDWLEEANAARPVEERLLVGALLLKAVALGLRAYPEFNGRWEDDALKLNEHINVASAIALRGGGLVIPALHDTDGLSLDELMKKLHDQVDRARRGQLRSSELADGTITVTSLGERGVQAVFGVIYPPQVALIGFGKIVERPWVVAGHVTPRPLLELSLAADHRASDGHRGALLLARIAKLLEEPEAL